MIEYLEGNEYRDTMTWTTHPMPTEESARDFLGAMHEIEYEPGGFTAALIAAALKADVGNRRKLQVVFPQIITPVILYKESDTGLRRLFEIAGHPIPFYLSEES